jgi:N-acylneuraminate cytidylyltransferase
LWLDNKPINYDLDNVPNSQDLPNIVKLTYGISIIDKDVMFDKAGLVGDNPGFITLDELESIDIDTEFDWQIAEAIYKNIKG